jgi:predicted regulator of amino acid metabolism with ACT domain
MFQGGEPLMWNAVKGHFMKRKAGLQVARLLIENGIRVDESGRFYVADVEVTDVSLARAAGVDRRVVRDTADYILADELMRPIFMKLRPAGTSLVGVASHLGYTVLKINADPHRSGILAGVTKILADNDLMVRQALADDPDLNPDPALTLVVAGRVPAKAVEEIQGLPYISSITLFG